MRVIVERSDLIFATGPLKPLGQLARLWARYARGEAARDDNKQMKSVLDETPQQIKAAVDHIQWGLAVSGVSAHRRVSLWRS